MSEQGKSPNLSPDDAEAYDKSIMREYERQHLSEVDDELLEYERQHLARADDGLLDEEAESLSSEEPELPS